MLNMFQPFRSSNRYKLKWEKNNKTKAHYCLQYKTVIIYLKLVSAIFVKFLFFHQMIALQKL